MIGVTGAGQPEYMITADDCDSKLAIDCVPMDEKGRRVSLLIFQRLLWVNLLL
jgi:hypothetical protein